MPTLKLLSHDMHYQEFGDAKNPKLLFSNSLGTNLSLWQAQVAALQDDYHIICYDTRGHGLSSTPATGFVLQDLAYDVLALLDYLHIETTHFCGISMGGLIGQWLAIHHGEQFQSIVISNTAAKIGQEAAWRERAAQVRAEGLHGLAATAHSRWFTENYVKTHPDVVMRLSQDLAAGSAEGYAQCCEALAIADVRGQLHEIDVPMCIIAGLEDPVTTVADAIEMQAAIFGSQMAEISGASHIANVEQASLFNQILHQYLAQFKATCKL